VEIRNRELYGSERVGSWKRDTQVAREVVDEQGKKRKDLIVMYPQRLFPCKENNAAVP
jgi:hypothetical protein